MKTNKTKVKKMIVMGLGGFFLFVFLAFILGFFIMILWNWLMPTLFALPEISYWQAWGLFILSKLLFCTGRQDKSHHNSDEPSEQRKRMKAKFKKWLDEEESESESEAKQLD
jgi:hypothetical protein